jgi:hypothetical protein
MQKLERPCSSPYEAWIPTSLQASDSYTTPLSEAGWPLCKLRYNHIRPEEKLGTLSPVTRRSNNGTIRYVSFGTCVHLEISFLRQLTVPRPPDFADRNFYLSHSSRVSGATDVAHLQRAQEGYDSLFKMAVWDVSQNVDRFRAPLGIVSAITPNGLDFASNQQPALNGAQLLLLQGMPLDRLYFANESQRDQQDLAGNAMSTTVIGASIIAALISGHGSLRPSASSILPSPSPSEIRARSDSTLVRSGLLTQRTLQPDAYAQLDLRTFRDEASLSARMCSCEGNSTTSKAAIRTCTACGHTSCTSCAGNPKQVYTDNVLGEDRAQTPDAFIRLWRPRLPARLKIYSIPDIRRLASQVRVSAPLLSSYSSVISKAQLNSQYFCIGEFTRQEGSWKFTYSSSQATLELTVGDDIQ